jgi:site-specific recombinase XerD
LLLAATDPQALACAWPVQQVHRHLPQGAARNLDQATQGPIEILRHTFAAHFIMGGGHIVTLKEILGHASLSMTMRYANLAPEHLNDAIRLGPLSGIALSLTHN